MWVSCPEILFNGKQGVSRIALTSSKEYIPNRKRMIYLFQQLRFSTYWDGRIFWHHTSQHRLGNGNRIWYGSDLSQMDNHFQTTFKLHAFPHLTQPTPLLRHHTRYILLLFIFRHVFIQIRNKLTYFLKNQWKKI